jgi:hypothetical protein
MTLSPLLMLWAALLLATVAVTVLRWNVGQKEDDHLHFMDNETHLVAAQVATARRLTALDRLRWALVVATLLGGIALAAAHMYRVWLEGAGLAR